jgi:hypothetical protein
VDDCVDVYEDSVDEDVGGMYSDDLSESSSDEYSELKNEEEESNNIEEYISELIKLIEDREPDDSEPAEDREDRKDEVEDREPHTGTPSSPLPQISLNTPASSRILTSGIRRDINSTHC